MIDFASFNPAAVFGYFIVTAVIAMFNLNPVTAVISLIGSLSLLLIRGKGGKYGVHIPALLTAAGCCIVNPLFSHNGKTVLLVINNNPVTYEAFIFGLVTGITAASVIYWYSSFADIMTSDKIIYTIGKASPKAALILTMALRFIPLFARQAKEINASQKAMGLYKGETIISRIKGVSRVFSAMITYATENIIITADSMAARGYTGRKRRPYAIFSFKRRDAFFTLAFLAFAGVSIYATASGAFDFWYYPEITAIRADAGAVGGYIAFALLCMMPTFIEGGDRLRWHYLKSTISHSHIPGAGGFSTEST
jgi:energy-coupling factor transport system permease protein